MIVFALWRDNGQGEAPSLLGLYADQAAALAAMNELDGPRAGLWAPYITEEEVTG